MTVLINIFTVIILSIITLFVSIKVIEKSDRSGSILCILIGYFQFFNLIQDYDAYIPIAYKELIHMQRKIAQIGDYWINISCLEFFFENKTLIFLKIIIFLSFLFITPILIKLYIYNWKKKKYKFSRSLYFVCCYFISIFNFTNIF